MDAGEHGGSVSGEHPVSQNAALGDGR
jgi:hypothetical protein